MQPKILKLVNDIRSSYWFIPAVMASAAIAMGTGVLYVDARIGADWLTELGWYQSNTSDGAREVLSTIAGSAITVAGVVFSITIVSVSFAAGQYGPRVLSNFMRDRGNQITLGTFIATFLYCIIVMRTIRGGDDDGFVPDFAVLIALLLALCSIAVLIYFIHHVPRSIHANSVVARIGRQLIDAFDEVYPEFIGEGKPEASSNSLCVPPALSHREAQRPIDPGQARAIRSPRSGYIEAIDDDALMEIAREHDLIVRLECRPGEFIHAGRVFAHSAPPAKADDKAVAEIADAFVVASQRTPLQDTSFLIDELVEVGTRALSPSVNDPFTAIACLDWLGAGLSELARRNIPSPLRADTDGALRVIALPLDFTAYLHRAFGQFRQYLAEDRNAAIHALRTLSRIASDTADPSRIAALRDEARALAALAAERLAPDLADSVQEALDLYEPGVAGAATA